MGIVKISELMHENIRIASLAYSRSINAQAEHWMKIGMLMEMYPELSHSDICKLLVRSSAESNDNHDGIRSLLTIESVHQRASNE